MRTALFLLASVLLLGGIQIVAKLFGHNYPSATLWGTVAFIAIWLAVTVLNMWVGVARAGYPVAEELPILLLLFGVPAVIAIILKWKFL
jgi:hypothetical protein